MSDAFQITMIWFVLALNGAFTVWLWWQYENLKIHVRESEREREKSKRDLTGGVSITMDDQLISGFDDKMPLLYGMTGPEADMIRRAKDNHLR